MNTDYKGYMEQVTTFEADETVEVGKAVAMKENGKVKLATSGKPVGLCIALRAGYAAVQTHGYMEVPYSGTANLGVTGVTADSEGKFAQNDEGRDCIVVYADSKYAGIIL